MMYSEFIEHSNFTEQYISYAEYTTFIEPIYMAADQIPTKQEFIAMLRDAFKSLVNPVVEKAMHSLSRLCILNVVLNRYRSILKESTLKPVNLHISI